MSSISGLSQIVKREPPRSRFSVVAVLLAGLVLVGCSNQFGFGITELPSARGWQPLPIGSWVLNDGIAAQAMSFCPRETCAHQGFAALLALDGAEADALERQLAQDPAHLARDFAKRATSPAASRQKPKKPPPPRPKTTTSISRFAEGSANGLLVEITADATGKRAATAVLFARDQARLIVAVAVAANADMARADAAATWRSR